MKIVTLGQIKSNKWYLAKRIIERKNFEAKKASKNLNY